MIKEAEVGPFFNIMYKKGKSVYFSLVSVALIGWSYSIKVTRISAYEIKIYFSQMVQKRI